MNNYYVYIYLDPRESGRYCYDNVCFLYKPFYVGKGKDKRYKEIKHSRSDYFKNTINEIKKFELTPVVFRLYKNLNEKESLNKEIELINEINIKNPGILVNFTNGGEGSSGLKHSEKTLEKLRKNFSDIKQEFERRNYILLTEENKYKDCYTKLEYICPEGHEGFISWNHFQRGHGCPIEGFESRCKKRKKDFDEIKNKFEKRNYKLLTEEKDYKNAFSKLNYECERGHKNLIRWNDFQQNHKCRICSNELKNKKLKGKNSILIIQDVVQIKLLLKGKKLSYKEIADIFEITVSTVYKIKNKETWSYINI